MIKNSQEMQKTIEKENWGLENTAQFYELSKVYENNISPRTIVPLRVTSICKL